MSLKRRVQHHRLVTGSKEYKAQKKAFGSMEYAGTGSKKKSKIKLQGKAHAGEMGGRGKNRNWTGRSAIRRKSPR